jgi:hypothetical protein
MILKGRAYGSGSGAKVGLLHTFILEHCWRRFQRITSVRTDHRISVRFAMAQIYGWVGRRRFFLRFERT